jgi:hypothetical protein
MVMHPFLHVPLTNNPMDNISVLQWHNSCYQYALPMFHSDLKICNIDTCLINVFFMNSGPAVFLYTVPQQIARWGLDLWWIKQLYLHCQLGACTWRKYMRRCVLIKAEEISVFFCITRSFHWSTPFHTFIIFSFSSWWRALVHNRRPAYSFWCITTDISDPVHQEEKSAESEAQLLEEARTWTEICFCFPFCTQLKIIPCWTLLFRYSGKIYFIE